MTDFIFKKLEEGFEMPEYRWSAMLNPPEAAPKKSAKDEQASVTEKTAKAEKRVKSAAKKPAGTEKKPKAGKTR